MSTRYTVIEIPISTRGIFGDFYYPGKIGHEYLYKCDNVIFVEDVIMKEPGEEVFSTSPLGSTVISGHEFYTGTLHAIIVASGAGKILKDTGTGAFSTTLVDFAEPIGKCVFVEGGKEGAALPRKLFIFTGQKQVHVVSGNNNTASPISTPPADWSSSYPVSGFLFEGRLCGFGNANDPHRLYFSTPTNHESFTGTGSLNISVYPGEGERLSAAIPIINGAILFKYPRGIYYLDATNPTTSNWRLYKLSSMVGTPSQKCVASHGGDVFFLDSSGIPFLLSFSPSRGAEIVDLTEGTSIGEFIRNKMNVNRLEDWQVSIDRRFNGGEVVISDGSIALKIDFATGKPRFRTSNRLPITSIWEVVGINSNYPTIMCGVGSNGVVYKGNHNVFVSGPSRYKFMISTNNYNLSHISEKAATHRKLSGSLEIEFIAISGTSEVAVDVYFDDKLSASKVVTISSGETSYDSGFEYDGGGSVYLGDASGRIINEQFKLFGSGKRLRLEIKEKEDNTAVGRFGLSRAYFYTSLGDERLP